MEEELDDVPEKEEEELEDDEREDFDHYIEDGDDEVQ